MTDIACAAMKCVPLRLQVVFSVALFFNYRSSASGICVKIVEIRCTRKLHVDVSYHFDFVLLLPGVAAPTGHVERFCVLAVGICIGQCLFDDGHVLAANLNTANVVVCVGSEHVHVGGVSVNGRVVRDAVVTV